jgi:hypothetical protein
MSRTSSLAAPLVVVAMALSSAAWAQVPLVVDVEVAEEATVSVVDGAVTVSGTLFCSQPVFADVSGEVTQKHGRDVISGFFFTSFLCNGLTPWTATTAFTSGRFVSGRARVLARAFGSDPETGAFAFDEDVEIVRLKHANE